MTARKPVIGTAGHWQGRPVELRDAGNDAVCTVHGDVWLVRGIDETLERIEWKRFATGLFQPLGLKIVDDKVYVVCRDQIAILHDTNNDGEADGKDIDPFVTSLLTL